MKIQTQEYDNIAVVELNGEFSDEFVKSFQDATTGVISTGKSGIVLDMSHVSFIDSQGLEQLLWLNDYCLENKRQLKLAGLDETCAKIIEITSLDESFDCYGELTEAVKSFV